MARILVLSMLLALSVSLALSVLLTPISGAAAQPAEDRARVASLTPEATRDLALRWWRWRLALPEIATPARDPPGRFCDTGETGDTWFLAGYLAVGSASQPTRRACALPAGRRIFFPVLTVLKFVHPGVDCRAAKAQAEADVNDATDLYAKVDGVELHQERRAAAADCTALGPGTTTLGTTPAAVDGFWLMLEPLPAGHHVLEWGVSYKAGSAEEGQVKRTSYHLDVR